MSRHELSDGQIEEVERLLSYHEHCGAQNGWVEDAVAFLADALPEWSAYRRAEPPKFDTGPCWDAAEHQITQRHSHDECPVNKLKGIPA